MLRTLILLGCASLASAAVPTSSSRITIVYDTSAARPELDSGWGFSALVDYLGHRVLFDTGTNPAAFIANLSKLGIEKSTIDRTIISHEHPSQDGPIARRLPMTLLYFWNGLFPQSTSEADAVGLHATPPVKGPTQIEPGIFSTGEISGTPDEQALLVDTPHGLVMLVSCAHPGIGKMLAAAKKQRGKDVTLLIGGLHLYEASDSDIRDAVGQIRKAGVQSVIPTHCTGQRATKLLREAYGPHFASGGAGKVIPLN